MKLSKKVATLIDVNPRKEHHGEKLALALDVKLQVHCEAKELDQFDPALRGFLFGEHGPRFPELGAVNWGREYERAKVQIEDHKMKDVTIRKIEFLPEPGDSVQITFLATFYPEHELIGSLAELMKLEVRVSVEQTQLEITGLMDAQKKSEAAA